MFSKIFQLTVALLLRDFCIQKKIQLTVTLLLKEGYLIPTHQRLATMPKAADKDTEKLLWFMIEDIFNADAECDRSLSFSLSLSHTLSLSLFSLSLSLSLYIYI